MAEDFKIGDIVQLKSGGPEMTVKIVPSTHNRLDGNYTCQWFAGKKLESGHFLEDTLKPVKPAGK